MSGDMETYMIEDVYTQYLEESELFELLRKPANQACNILTVRG